MDLDVIKNDRSRSRSNSILSFFGLPSPYCYQEKKFDSLFVQLFDGRNLNIEFDEKLSGYMLLEQIAAELGDSQKACYLGLLLEPFDSIPKWMDLKKSVSKQIIGCKKTLLLRIKFYPADPITEMAPKVFALLLFYQLRHDLSRGRLLGKTEDHCALLAYTALVDEEAETISKMKSIGCSIRKDKNIFPGLDKSMENEIKALILDYSEMTADEALFAFLKLATRMDTYGVEPFILKDQRGTGICVGFNCHGLSVFKNNQRVNFFKWDSISSITWEGCNVIIKVNILNERRKIGFKCESRSDAYILHGRIEEAATFYSTEDNLVRSSHLASVVTPKKSTTLAEDSLIRRSHLASVVTPRKSTNQSLDSISSVSSVSVPHCRIIVREFQTIFNSMLVFADSSHLDDKTSPDGAEVNAEQCSANEELSPILSTSPPLVAQVQRPAYAVPTSSEPPQYSIANASAVLDVSAVEEFSSRDLPGRSNQVSVLVHHFPKYPFHSSLSASRVDPHHRDISLS